MTETKAGGINMLTGPLYKNLVLFAVPVALTVALQQLFNTADVLVLGKFVGKEAMAAVGNNVSLIGLLVNLFMGISLGANVLVARFIGAKKLSEVKQAVQSAFLLAIVTGISVAALGEIFLIPIVKAMGVPAEVLAMTESYMRFYFLGMPFMAIYNFEAAIFRSQGDTRTPLKALFVGSIVNAVLNLWFVLVWQLSIMGVAIATSLANLLCAVMLFYKLVKTPLVIRLRLTDFQVKGDYLKEIIRVGLPAGVQGMVFSLSNLVVQAAINSLGPEAMAGSAAAFTLEINIYCIVSAFSQASTTFVSQNYGARNLLRCREVAKKATRLCLLTMGTACALLLCFCDDILKIFSNDPLVLQMAKIRLWIIVAPEFINAFIDMLSAVMRGFGYSLMPAVLTLIGICGVRISWVYFLFPSHPTFEFLMATYPVSWLVTTVLIFGLYRMFMKHLSL